MFPGSRENAGTIYAAEEFQPRAAAGFTCLQSGKLGEPGLMEPTKTRKDANKSAASRCNECVRMKRQKSGLKMGQRIRLLVNPDCERAFITATPGEAAGRGARAGAVPGTMENPSCLGPAQLFSIEVTMSRCRFPSNYVSCESLPSRASNGFFPLFPIVLSNSVRRRVNGGCLRGVAI